MTHEVDAPKRAVAPSTLVFDPESDRHVMVLEGQLPLPVGTRIELDRGDAIVASVRLLAGDPALICLDCTIPDGYWDRHPQFVDDGD